MTALTHELLTRLEAAYQGVLSEEDTQKLDEELAELPGGAEAAAEYRRLWEAMQALQAQEQRAKMNEWEAEWERTNDAEWVEWYLTDQLSEENRQRVDQRRAEDEEFALLFDEQEQLMAGFSAAKGEQFRKQLNQWDQSSGGASDAPKVRKLQPGWRRFIAVAASVALIMVAMTVWNINGGFSDQALADKYYQVPPTGNTMGQDEGGDTAYLDVFTDAHTAMQQKDYGRARLLFEQLITTIPPASFSDDDLKYYQDNLDWNLILALLGQDESGQMLQQRLDVILASPEHTYFPKAQQLQDDLDKFWR